MRAFIEMRREALAVLLARGRARGELAEGADPELALDVCFGVLRYRLLVGLEPLGPAAARGVAALLAGSRADALS